MNFSTLSQATAILLIAFTISAALIANSPNYIINQELNEPLLETGPIPADPYTTTQPPELILSKGLLAALHRATAHRIGYLPNPNGRRLYIIDLDSETLIGKVFFNKALTGPRSVAYSPKTNRIILLRGSNGNDLLILRAHNLSLEKQIPLSRGKGMVLNRDGSIAYVFANYGFNHGMIYSVDLNSYNITSKIETSTRINDFELSPDGKSIYYASDNGIKRLSLSDSSVQALSVFEIPQTLSVNPEDSTVYIPYKPDIHTEYSDVLFLDASGGSKRISNVTRFIHDMGVTPDGRLLYCLNWIDGSMEIIDTITLEVRYSSARRRFDDHYRVFFPSSGDYAYLVYSGHIPNMEEPSTVPCYVGVVTIETGEVLRFITLDSLPMGDVGNIAFAPK